MKASIILVGIQGSGKGTQAKLLNSVFQTLHLSTGDMCRTKAKKLADSGKLIDDSVIFHILREELQELDTTTPELLIWDGIPRTVEQARRFPTFLTKNGLPPVRAVIHLRITDDTAKERVVIRIEEAFDEGGQVREDDLVITKVEQRLADFHKHTEPCFEVFKEQDIPVLQIDGTQRKEVIAQKIIDFLQKILSETLIQAN